MICKKKKKKKKKKERRQTASQRNINKNNLRTNSKSTLKSLENKNGNKNTTVWIFQTTNPGNCTDDQDMGVQRKPEEKNCIYINSNTK